MPSARFGESGGESTTRADQATASKLRSSRHVLDCERAITAGYTWPVRSKDAIAITWAATLRTGDEVVAVQRKDE